MDDLLRIATVKLVSVLATPLPAMSDDWWEKHVVDGFSFQTQRTVQKRDCNRPKQLNLAVQLRILDQNRFELSAANGCRAQEETG